MVIFSHVKISSFRAKASESSLGIGVEKYATLWLLFVKGRERSSENWNLAGPKGDKSGRGLGFFVPQM